jgi:hypothetical protein
MLPVDPRDTEYLEDQRKNPELACPTCAAYALIRATLRGSSHLIGKTC